MTETEQIDKYILDHIAPEGDYLYRLYRATNIHTIHGRMASGHLQGRLLKMLVQMVQPKMYWKWELLVDILPFALQKVCQTTANSIRLK